MVEAFHGSGVRIDTFDFAFTNKGNDQYGSGFYFTSDFDEASRYAFALKDGQEKLGGSHCPTIHRVELTLNNPLNSDAKESLTLAQVRSIIEQSPSLNEVLSNFGDVDYEGLDSVLLLAAKMYVRPKDTLLLQTLFSISNDFFDDQIELFNKTIRDVLGYDGIICDNRVKDKIGNVHYVAWFPEQIRIIEYMDASPEGRVKRKGFQP